MQVLEYSLTLSGLAGDGCGAYSIGLVGNQIAESGRLIISLCAVDRAQIGHFWISSPAIAYEAGCVLWILTLGRSYAGLAAFITLTWDFVVWRGRLVSTSG
jgi:hypothetical protein